ncbi:hypothetical protein [Flaviaesturariibacter amylovorans]|uniref:Uncharacterized protein n=1 Tax=Flaviaesturariibacter amylovorans TaxID=1084520 RepID=A0ABP8GBF0_9BACT
MEPITHDGRLFAWWYAGENPLYRGCHLRGDEAGCTALMALFEAIEASATPVSQLLPLSPATAAVARVAGRAFRVIQQLALHYDAGEASCWQTREDGATLHLHFGARELALLQTALLRILKGEGNFALGDQNDEQLLHFWPLAG